MNNLIISDQQKSFWVWVDPDDFLVKHNIGMIGKISSLPNNDNLMFLPNPNYNAPVISPFHNNIINFFRVEYNLEIFRKDNCNDYPSRLNAIFLFDSDDEAYKYYNKHKDHVGNRELKKCISVGHYIYSKHDSSWINFFRMKHGISVDVAWEISNLYWSGVTVKENEPKSCGFIWSEEPVFEILFIGTLEFQKTL